MKRILGALALSLLAFAAPASASDRLQVVASFSILGDMVRQVTGNLADVATIVGPDADAHLYQPNTADAKAVAGADIVFVNGLGFETWSDALINNAGGDASVIVATGGVEPILVDGEIDPHAVAADRPRAGQLPAQVLETLSPPAESPAKNEGQSTDDAEESDA